MINLDQQERPLDGLLVLDFSQFLAGPLCSLKLADLGARVIKVERPEVGDLCRYLYLTDTEVDGDNLLFHAINRNKESITADLKDPEDQAMLKQLLRQADVMIQNFRPEVIERLGFGYDQVAQINPNIIYGSISGYGGETDWKHHPGQDLLAQARSGLMWLSGQDNQNPVPMGLAVADMLAGNALAQGILAALVKRSIKAKGSLVETSLIEATLDFQFEVLTSHLNDGGRLPKRSSSHGAHAYLGAPYGVYPTSDGFLALAMVPCLTKLAELMQSETLMEMARQPSSMFTRRDEINQVVASELVKYSTNYWLAELQPSDIWCSEVLNWDQLRQSAAYQQLEMEQSLTRAAGTQIDTLRGPLRFDGKVLKSNKSAPSLGKDNQRILSEFGLTQSQIEV